MARRWSVPEEKVRTWVSDFRLHGIDGGRAARFRFGCAGITTPAWLGQPFLREKPGLFGGQFPAMTQGGLAAPPVFARYARMNTLRTDRAILHRKPGTGVSRGAAACA